MFCFFFFKQKTAYEMRISDWSSDVCSSDLPHARRFSAGKAHLLAGRGFLRRRGACALSRAYTAFSQRQGGGRNRAGRAGRRGMDQTFRQVPAASRQPAGRSEEHTSELQSLMLISHAVFCLNKKYKLSYAHPNRSTY